jgi:hypothetical protein
MVANCIGHLVGVKRLPPDLTGPVGVLARAEYTIPELR